MRRRSLLSCASSQSATTLGCLVQHTRCSKAACLEAVNQPDRLTSQAGSGVAICVAAACNAPSPRSSRPGRGVGAGQGLQVLWVELGEHQTATQGRLAHPAAGLQRLAAVCLASGRDRCKSCSQGVAAVVERTGTWQRAPLPSGGGPAQRLPPWALLAYLDPGRNLQRLSKCSQAPIT